MAEVPVLLVRPGRERRCAAGVQRHHVGDGADLLPVLRVFDPEQSDVPGAGRVRQQLADGDLPREIRVRVIPEHLADARVEGHAASGNLLQDGDGSEHLPG